MPRLCVLPADPIGAYIRKGEIKPRYFDPEGLFDEVHLVTSDDAPVDRDVLRTLVGDARVELHPLGDWRPLSLTRSPYRGPYFERAVGLIRDLAPDVVRAYTPVEVGWLARAAARAAGAPYVISVHGNWDLDYRRRLWERRRWRGWLYFVLTRALVEPKVLRDAALVMCAYEFAARYVRQFRTHDVEVVYNRVYLDRFRPPDRRPPGPFTALFVGRCEENKGQDLLVRAMARFDGRLILVGDGPTRPAIEHLARLLGISNRIEIVPAIPNERMPEVYARAHCYVSAILYGGIQIPHLEAMASGLPIVVARPLWEDRPEQMGDVALVAPRTPEGIAAAMRHVAERPDLAEELGRRGRARAEQLDGRRMERRERDLYAEVIARAGAGA